MGYFDTPETTTTNTEKTYEPIAEGSYTVAMDDIDIDLDYKTKTGEAAPRVNITWLFDDKRKAWTNVMFEENMRWKVKVVAEGMGIDTDILKKMPKDSVNDTIAAQVFYDIAKELMGNSFAVTTSNREWNGKTYTDVNVDAPLSAKATPPVKNFAPTKEQLTPEEVPF